MSDVFEIAITGPYQKMIRSHVDFSADYSFEK
jgi:hypothetical protein